MFDTHAIGVISWDFARPKGGMGRSLSWIVSALRAEGIGVHVGAPVADEGTLPLLARTQTVGGHLLFSFLLPFVLRSWTVQYGVRRLLFPVGPGGVLLWKRPPLPYDVIVYHTYLQQYRCVPGQRWKRVFVPFERRMLQRADQILCFCDDTARVLREGYGMDEKRVRVLPHAIDGGRAAIYRGCTVQGLCVCIARLEERKGVRVLLEAWKRVTLVVSGARLVIVGSGAQARRIDRMIARMKNVSVQRIPRLPQADLDRLVSAAQVAVCPSYLEGFGLVAAEAMAAGTAVIASEVDGLRALIEHERTGLLVPAGDADALADGIVRLLQDDALRGRLAEVALYKARERFDPAVAARAVVDAIACCTIES